MNIRAVLRTSWKDLFNRRGYERGWLKIRVAADVVAGLVTLALATAISVLSITFGHSARELLSDAMEPTRTVASIVDIKPRAALFTTRQYEELNALIGQFEADGSVSARSNIVDSIQDDVFRLKNASCKRARMTGIRLWSAAAESPFLDPAFGVRYVYGGAFGNSGGRPGCETPAPRSDRCPASTSVPAASAPDDGDVPDNRFRLGVIVNLSYLKKHGNFKSTNVERLLDEAQKLATIPIEFAVADRFRPSGAPDPRVDLCVTGIIDEPTYPHLIFTEALAKAFYLESGGRDDDAKSRTEPRGAFHGRYAADMWQWETDRPLISLAGARSTAYFSSDPDDFDYVGLREAGFEAHDRIRLHIRDWKAEGERERIGAGLVQERQLPPIEGEVARELIALMHDATTGPPQSTDSLFEDAPDDRVRDELRHRLNSATTVHDPALAISPSFTFDAVGKARRNFRLRDIGASVFLDIVIDSNPPRVTVRVEPAWRMILGEARVATALLRLQGVIGAYEFVMLVVVLVLAASASLLLAFGHVVRKTRDIGLLLTNGARPAAVFSIYIAQIAVISVAGWMVGTALSPALAHLLEPHASETLTKFLEAVASEQDVPARTILEVTPSAIFQAFMWVVPAALAGGIYPVVKASWSDPLSNLSKVG